LQIGKFHAIQLTWLLVISPPLADAQEILAPLVVSAEAEDGADQEALTTLVGGGDLSNLLQLMPNAYAGGAPGSIFSLRGLSQEGTLVAGNRTNPGLSVMSGSFARSTNSLWVLGAPSWDMQNLVMEYGPQLFKLAPVAPGGELRLDPRPPEFFNQGRWLAEIGTQGSYRSGTTFNSVWIPDKLAMRLNLFVDGNDGGITNLYDDDDRFAATDRAMIRGQWRWRPAGDDTSVVDARIESTWIRGHPLALAGMRPDFELFERRVALNSPERVPADHLGLSLNLDTQLTPEHRLEAWVAWQDASGYQLADLDSTPLFNWWFRTDVNEERLNAGAQLRRENEQSLFAIGVYADTADYNLFFRGRGFSNDAAGEPFATRVDESVDMAAIFVRGEVEVAEAWWAHGGLRLDAQRREVDMNSKFRERPLIRDDDKVRSVEWLPELGMEWRREATRAGLKLARAYRPAGVGYALTLGQTESYGAERGWEIQAHGETTWRSLLLSGQVFHAKINGQQVPVVQPGGYPALDQWIVNAGSSLRYGGELELAWQGPGAFHAGIHGGWLQTEFRDSVAGGFQNAGMSFPNAPEWSAGVIIAWKPDDGWFGESALTWRDETYAQFDSPVPSRLEDRLELSARIGYRWRQAECYLFGTNLLNRDFALVRRDFTGTGARIEGSPNLPRVIGLGWMIHW
jgi:outer membrane receptor protein involved in Fe transport